MSIENSDLFRAIAHVRGTGNVYGYATTGRPQSGFNALIPIVHPGAGDFTLTLMEEIALSEMSVKIAHTGTSGAQVTHGWQLISPNQIRVTVFRAGALANDNFDIIIIKFPWT